MTLPALIFGALVATLYGVLFHVWKGGGLGRLILDLIMSWAGFWLGHFLANWFEISIARLGPLSLGAATLGSIVMLALGNWLSQVDRPAK